MYFKRKQHSIYPFINFQIKKKGQIQNIFIEFCFLFEIAFFFPFLSNASDLVSYFVHSAARFMSFYQFVLFLLCTSVTRTAEMP